MFKWLPIVRHIAAYCMHTAAYCGENDATFRTAPRGTACDVNATLCNVNKAIVDYISSAALCTPVTPFPPIGDAAYRQRAGGVPSHGHR